MNAHGALTGDEVTIDTRRKSLGNTGGSVAAQGVRRITCGADLSLDIGDLDNTVGMIRVQIDGGAVKNVEGRLATAQGMTLMSHSLDNEGGKMCTPAPYYRSIPEHWIIPPVVMTAGVA